MFFSEDVTVLRAQGDDAQAWILLLRMLHPTAAGAVAHLNLVGGPFEIFKEAPYKSCPTVYKPAPC